MHTQQMQFFPPQAPFMLFISPFHIQQRNHPNAFNNAWAYNPKCIRHFLHFRVQSYLFYLHPYDNDDSLITVSLGAYYTPHAKGDGSDSTSAAAPAGNYRLLRITIPIFSPQMPSFCSSRACPAAFPTPSFARTHASAFSFWSSQSCQGGQARNSHSVMLPFLPPTSSFSLPTFVSRPTISPAPLSHSYYIVPKKESCSIM